MNEHIENVQFRMKQTVGVDGGVVASLLLWMESPAVSSRRILVGNSLKGKEKFKLLRSNLMKATGPTKTDALRITYFYWCGCLFAISDGFSRCIFSKLHVGISLKWKEVVALFIYF